MNHNLSLHNVTIWVRVSMHNLCFHLQNFLSFSDDKSRPWVQTLSVSDRPTHEAVWKKFIIIQSDLSCSTLPLLQSTPILSPALPTAEMVCGTRKKVTTDWSSEMRSRSSLKVILHLPESCPWKRQNSLRRATPFVRRWTKGDTADPHRVGFCDGDQCLRIHVLEFGNRAPKISFEFVQVAQPYSDLCTSKEYPRSTCWEQGC